MPKSLTGSGVLVYDYVYNTVRLKNKQSPIIRMDFRLHQLQTYKYDAKLRDFVFHGNWWPDSLLRVWGRIDTGTAFLLFECDTTPEWNGNATPIVPLYMGRVYPEDGKIQKDALARWNRSCAIFAGTAFQYNGTNESSAYTESEFFLYNNPVSRASRTLLPLLRDRSYVPHPGNGIDSVILKEGSLGKGYQAFVLSWNTGPEKMEPNRMDASGRQYQRAWQKPGNDEYKGWFNPSRYSEKVHVSPPRLVNTQEGNCGMLENCWLMNPLNLEDETEISTNSPCDTNEERTYLFYRVSGISPFTKRPGTAYRPAGLAIVADDKHELMQLPRLLRIEFNPAVIQVESGKKNSL